MPRYHFHVVEDGRERDNDGQDLPSDGAAQREAVRYCAELLQANAAELWSNGQCRVEVTDQDGVHKWSVVVLAIDAPPPTD